MKSFLIKVFLIGRYGHYLTVVVGYSKPYLKCMIIFEQNFDAVFSWVGSPLLNLMY